MPRAPTPSVADRIAGWLITWRVPLALAAVVLAAAAVERSRHLEFSRSIDAMFDRTDPALIPYRRIARTFGSTEVVLAAYDDPELFSVAGIERLRQLTDRLTAMPGIASTSSLSSTPLGTRIIDLDASPTARKFVRLLEGYAVGADRRTACVVCVLEPPAAGLVTAREQAVSRADTIDRLRAIMAELPAGTIASRSCCGKASRCSSATATCWAPPAVSSPASCSSSRFAASAGCSCPWWSCSSPCGRPAACWRWSGSG
jgi:hypothetical protein